MKKFAAIAVAASMFALAACDDNAPPADPPVDVPADQGVDDGPPQNDQPIEAAD